MIELLTANTPNGKKISIMLEEISYKYKVTKVYINKGEQFSPKFRAISPFSKIPVLIEHEKNITLRESAKKLGYIEEEDFDRIVNPKEMIQPN